MNPAAAAALTMRIENSQFQRAGLGGVARERVLPLEPIAQMQVQMRPCFPYKFDLRVVRLQGELREVFPVRQF